MNIAITNGIALMPTPFADGLDVWSSGDGRPGDPTYDGAANAAFVPADQDFGGALELVKTSATQKLRYTGETPILPGIYLRVRIRVKAVSGPLPSVRIAGWPGGPGGAPVSGLPQAAPAVALTAYGEVVTLEAIVGTGDRTGVDLVWPGALFGHFGLDLTGATGGVVRIDDVEIEDVTDIYLREMLNVVDVRDYGAVGDGLTDDSAAFEAADAAAAGRTVVVSPGTYLLAGDVTFQNPVQFEGTVQMAGSNHLICQRNFSYQTYLDAFEDEEEAFKRAYQALINFADHESLDLDGYRINLTEPVDMLAAEPGRPSFETRRVIRNGQLRPVAGPAWDPDVVVATASYSAASPLQLTNVQNVGQIAVGSLVEGNGVGREVYVRAVDAGAATITLSQPLFDAEGVQPFTFTRFKYLIDFSRMTKLSQFIFDSVDFQCEGIASGILLPPDGLTFNLSDCFINKPADRGLTSIGGACQGMLIDRCQFLSNEASLPVENRKTVGFNANANDVKIRDCRVLRFKHFCVLAGTGSIIANNHWFHGDDEVQGVRKGGIILTTPNAGTTITGNYIDNNFIEWTNEHDATPALGTQFSFGGLTIVGNFCITKNVAPWFRWLVVKPYGPGHYIHGLTVAGNVFRTLGGNVDRVEAVDTTYADLDYGRMRNITWTGNTYNGVSQPAFNPHLGAHDQATEDASWTIDPSASLPFEGKVRAVESIQPYSAIRTAANQVVHDLPWVQTNQGPGGRQFIVNWSQPVRGVIRYAARMDNPI